MWVNLRRQVLRQAIPVIMAIGAAMSKDNNSKELKELFSCLKNVDVPVGKEQSDLAALDKLAQQQMKQMRQRR